jgi:hypothetical protein
MKQFLIKLQMGMAVPVNNIMFQLAEDVLQHTIPTGIPQYMQKFHQDLLLKIDPIIEDEGPKVLTMKDLSFGFNIILVTLGVSCVVFVLEVIKFQLKIKIRRLVREFIGKLLVLLNVSQWLRRYHA